MRPAPVAARGGGAGAGVVISGDGTLGGEVRIRLAVGSADADCLANLVGSFILIGGPGDVTDSFGGSAVAAAFSGTRAAKETGCAALCDGPV